MKFPKELRVMLRVINIMMSQLRENILDSIGTSYQKMSAAMERGDTLIARRALNRISELKKRLRSARSDDAQRFMHISNSDRSCMVCQDEDNSAVIVQSWNGCEGCEVTRFRSFSAAYRSLTQSGYISMAAA